MDTMGKDVLHSRNDAARTLNLAKFPGMLELTFVKEQLQRAYENAAKLSEDENTQNGSVIRYVAAAHGRDAIHGANRFPGKVHKRQDRPAKYNRIIHAEVDGILRCVRDQNVLGDLSSAIIYCPWNV
ncbi:MAG TPA: hypothetical protein VM510_09035, partial [Caulifigura sp.]|nr:hypothetical protein [Caulifigura sp.]